MLLIFLLSTNTFAETLPSLNEALRHITSKDRIEIDPDEFKDFNPENTGKVNYGNFKMIVLQRKAADKEFTKLDSGYPDNYIEGFPDDFTGVDIGKPTVWLRYDVMRSIPASYKARTLEEADIIVIAEDEYVFSGTLSVADYKSENSGEKEIPTVVNSPEELDEFLSKQQPEIDSIYYYPKFSVYNLVTIYDAKTKKCEYYNTKYTPAKIFARNRDAVEHWMLMEQVAELYDSLINDQNDNI